MTSGPASTASASSADRVASGRRRSTLGSSIAAAGSKPARPWRASQANNSLTATNRWDWVRKLSGVPSAFRWWNW